MSERVRDSAYFQSEIDKVREEINDVEAQVHKKEAALEQATHKKFSVTATLREIVKKLERPDLSEQERAELVRKQQWCVADLTDAENDLEWRSKLVELLRKKKEQLRREKEQLRRMKEQLRKEELQQEGAKLQQWLEALPSPSDMAHSEYWSREDNHASFKCFRPTHGVGPSTPLPVALYDPVLDTLVAQFTAALKGCDDGDGSDISSGGGGADSVPPSHEDCEITISLCQAMARSYYNETGRMVAFTELLEDYLNERIDSHCPIVGLEYATDGTLLCEAGGPEPQELLPVYIQEVKCEIGDKGDPYFQGQRYYQLYLANPRLAALLRKTVLPVLFLELVGPYFRVSALASPADVTVVCEPLTPYLHLFNMYRERPDHMTRLALVLRALKSGIALLKSACSQLPQAHASPAAAGSVSLSAVSALAEGAGPVPEASSSSAATSADDEFVATAGQHVAVPLRDPSLQLPYPLRPGSGFEDVKPIGAGVYNPLYFAVYKGGAVVVKFALMSADAIRVHRAWAAAHLAPKVVLEKLLPCGLVMLVMEQLAPADGWVTFSSLSPDLKQQLNGTVMAALGRAHAIVVDADRGLPGVHADLRQTNVMVRLPHVDSGGGAAGASVGGGEDAAGSSGSCASERQTQVRFVDFDWSGLQGHTWLPAFSRKWLEGYNSCCQVTQEYDRVLWEHERVHGPS